MRYKDRKTVSLEEKQAYFASLVDLAEQRRALETKQRSVTVQIDAERPIAVALTGDWHVGQIGTDHRLLQEHNKMLADQDDLYCIGMGDYTQNAKVRSRPGSSLYDAAFPNPDDQLEFALAEMRKLRWLALTSGCHWNFDFQASGRRPLTDICKELDTVCLGNGGVVKIQVGQEEYTFGVRHRYKNESNKNTTNAQKNFDDEYPEDETYDVVALAHLHYPDVQQRHHRGRLKTYVRSGSYYVWDEFGDEIGGYRGQPGVPILVLYPDRHLVLPLMDLEQALVIHKRI